MSGAGVAVLQDSAASGDDLWVVWQDDRTGEGELYLRRSTDGGMSWQAADATVPVGSAGGYCADSRYPRVAVVGDAVHLVWMDNRWVNCITWDLYYRRGRLLVPLIFGDGFESGGISARSGSAGA